MLTIAIAGSHPTLYFCDMSKPILPPTHPDADYIGPGIEVSRRNGRFSEAELRHNLAVSKAIQARKAKATPTIRRDLQRLAIEILR